MYKMLKRISSCLLAVVMCLGITAVVNTATVEYSVADAATGYYSSVTAKSGTALLGQLHDLITSTHSTYTSYNDCKTPATVMKTDPGTGYDTVRDFYTQEDISSKWDGNNAGTWNREHVWCQSLSNGLWGTSGGGSDMHHLRPSEVRLNGTRGNHTFGEADGGTPAYYKDTSGNNKYLGGYVKNDTFEPLDKVKGDVARIVMYVYTHYNTYSNVGGTTNGQASCGTLKFTNIMTPGNESDAIKLLLEWNKKDPVDNIERTRNEAVYAIQGNRNPFIDNESYADAIWGNGSATPGGDSTTLTGLSLSPSTLNLTVGQTSVLTVTATPSNASKAVTWSTSNSSVATVTDGTVTAKAEGTATITATSTSNTSIKATATVNVTKSSSTAPATGTVTIDIGSFTSLSSGYGLQSWSSGGMSGTAYIYGAEKGMMQFNSSKEAQYIASTSPSPGFIKSVTAKLNSKTGESKNWKLLTSTSAYGEVTSNPSSGNSQGSKAVTVSGTKWTVSGNDTCFALVYEGSGACYLDSVVIEYGDNSSALQGLTLSPSSLSLTEGESSTLTVTATPAGASNAVTWSTSNSPVATVSNGTVTAIKAGTAIITAISTENPSIKATCMVTVNEEEKPQPPVLEELTVNHTEYELDIGGTVKLTVTPTPSNANGDVDWSSSNTTVATVSSDGTVTALKAGTAIITAISTENPSIKATCTVTVKEEEKPQPPVLEELTLNHTEYELDIGGTVKLAVTPNPSNANGEVNWSSSDTAVATVSSDGTVIALKAGTATITATSTENPSIKATCMITVKEEEKPQPPVLEGLTINLTECRLEEGESVKLSVTASPADANGEVVWSSSDTAVATVSADGRVTALKAGTATITATSTENPEIKVTCTVTVWAEEPVNPPVEENAKIKAFHDAVEGLVRDGTLSQMRVSINKAINAYNELTEEEKEQVSESDIATLLAVIDEYNEYVLNYNQNAQDTEQSAWGKE